MTRKWRDKESGSLKEFRDSTAIETALSQKRDLQGLNC